MPTVRDPEYTNQLTASNKVGSDPAPQSRHVDNAPMISHGVMVVRHAIPVVPPNIHLAKVIFDSKKKADLFIASKITFPDDSLENAF